MHNAIVENKRNTAIIMVVFIALIGVIGWGFSAYYGSVGIFWGSFIGAGIYALIQYFAAAKLALSMNGAKEIQKQDDPRLWRTVENIAITNGMPMPKVYVVEDAAPNAFATGR